MAKHSTKTTEERDEFLAKIKADFDERLARIAATRHSGSSSSGASPRSAPATPSATRCCC
jgi:hypothetical protein